MTLALPKNFLPSKPEETTTMGTFALTTYVLIWPALVAIVLGVLIKAFFTDWITARREGRSMV